ncbi:MAG: Clp protease [Propionibacteriales bacterium]|nr:Clp protease [Propionibacteriales bacterium]
MFERFTREAREVAVRAQTEARALGHNYVGAEHLFLAALTQPDAPGVTAVTRRGISAASFRRTAIHEVLGGPVSPTDSEALRTLGIDLDEVRRRVEASFGPGALDISPGQIRRSSLPWRRNRCTDGLTGHIPFTPRAKRALERAFREAQALQDNYIGVEHVLLGLLDPEGNVAVEVLRRLGVEPDALRDDVLTELGRAA